jgi:hypothetical protein
MPWLRQLVPGLSLQRHGFSPKATHVRCGGYSNTGTGFLQVLQFSCQVHSSKHPYSHNTSLTYNQPYTIIATNNIIKKTMNEWKKVFKL